MSSPLAWLLFATLLLAAPVVSASRAANSPASLHLASSSPPPTSVETPTPDVSRGCRGEYQCVNGRCLELGECRCDQGFIGRNCSMPAEFDVAGPGHGLRIRYAIDPIRELIHCEFSREGADQGWFGLMLGSADMINGDVWIGYVADSGEVFVQDRWSDRQGRPKFDTELEGGKDDLFDTGGWHDGDSRAVYFSRKLDTGDPRDVVIPADGSDLSAGWASHDSSGAEDGAFRRHTFRKGGTINFASGRAQTRQRFLSHGIVMTVGWAGLASLGASAASRARLKTGQLTGFFRKAQQLFQFHRAIQSTALATIAVGFALAVAEGPPFFEWSFANKKTFHSAHMVTGVTLTVLAFLQGFIAFAWHGDHAHLVHRFLGAGLLVSAWFWQLPSGAYMVWGRTAAFMYGILIPVFWTLVYFYQRSSVAGAQSGSREEYRRLQHETSNKAESEGSGSSGASHQGGYSTDNKIAKQVRSSIDTEAGRR